MSVGAHIFIHNDSLTPSTFEGIDLDLGHITNIAVYKTYNTKLPKPYSDCTDNLDNINAFDSDLFRFIIKQNNTYRRTDCYNLCYQNKLYEECSCQDSSLKKYIVDSNICLTQTQTASQNFCYYKVFNDFSKKGFNELCSDYCPAECQSIQYSISTSSSSYPSRAYAHNMLQDPSLLNRFDNPSQVTYETIKESTLGVSVYFDALESTNIEESPQIEFVDLIAGIGGTLGLFLGISVLSLFEFVEIFLEIIFFKMKQGKRIDTRVNQF